jgi:hypothetical protein
MKLIVSLCIGLVAVVSCDGVCACPPPYDPPSVVAWGQVTLNDGSPASGAAIRASITVASSVCVEGSTQFVGLANSQGRYRLLVRKETPLDDSTCVFLHAAYPGEAPPTHEAILGPFRMRFSRPVVDSVHADFQLVPLAQP